MIERKRGETGEREREERIRKKNIKPLKYVLFHGWQRSRLWLLRYDRGAKCNE